MIYFLDTEFIEAGPHHPLHLISIALVCDDGREYYAESTEFPSHLANEWVRRNVFPHLTWTDAKSRLHIATDVYAFIQHGQPDTAKREFWGYYADYDWVVFCQLFGAMADLPHAWPMYCRDLKQWWDDVGNPTLPVQGKEAHHALGDARWHKQVWHFLQECSKKATP